MTYIRKGERLMDSETGEVIATAARDIEIGEVVAAEQFIPNFTPGDKIDRRCFRIAGYGLQAFVEGEWRSYAG